MQPACRTFSTVLSGRAGDRLYLELPFDPDEAWGPKERHHVTGTLNGVAVRGPVTREGDGWRLALGPAWQRDSGMGPGTVVSVVLAPEGPQRQGLPEDLAAALDADPEAAAFFDALATFYRKGYLRWLDGASRRPEVRAQRVREVVALLRAGKKTRE